MQVVACLYLVMVIVMVGLNYRLRGRDTGAKERARDTAEKEGEEVAEVEAEAEEAVMVRAASVCFSEGTGSYSSLVSADTWPRGSQGSRAGRATVQV